MTTSDTVPGSVGVPDTEKVFVSVARVSPFASAKKTVLLTVPSDHGR